MARPVVPIRSLATRLPDAGRIRIGRKVRANNGKERPDKLDRFRFTSTDKAAIDQVADIYGGIPQPWSDPKAAAGQHEVITDASEIRVALPPDPLGGTPIYEMWSGGGCARRCDGEWCEMLTQGRDGIDLQRVPCLCDAKGELACKLTTRLSVLLPEIRFVGVWRIDTHSWNAAHELPGMVEVIRSLQDRGIVRGILRVEHRIQQVAGETRRFAVPVLGLDASVEALAAGHASVGALGASGYNRPVAEIGSGGHGSAEDHDRDHPHDGDVSSPAGSPSTDPETDTPGPRATAPDDDVIDAEIIDDAPTPADQRGVTVADITNAAADAFGQWAEAARAAHKVTMVRDRLRHAVIYVATDGRTASLTDCTPGDMAGVYRRLRAIIDGRVAVIADPLDDGGGATFEWANNGGGMSHVSVRWSDFETEAVTA